MELENVAQDSIAEIVARVAGAMETAISDYGPEAVDLAMLAYRISAMQDLAYGFSFLAINIALVFVFLRIWKPLEGDFSDPDAVIPRVLFSIFAAVPFVWFATAFINRILHITNWIAAFGYPELLIATKALKAAGLM